MWLLLTVKFPPSLIYFIVKIVLYHYLLIIMVTFHLINLTLESVLMTKSKLLVVKILLYHDHQSDISFYQRSCHANTSRDEHKSQILALKHQPRMTICPFLLISSEQSMPFCSICSTGQPYSICKLTQASSRGLPLALTSRSIYRSALQKLFFII